MAGQAFKGFWGEFKLRLAMFFLLGSGFKKFHNVTVLLSDGKTSQIDHVVVSRYGIFVIETKNYKGLITVNENTGYWKQSFSRNSYDFYSPVKQNKGHISSMKYMLKNKDYPYFNIVSFVGAAKFASKQLPEGVAKSVWSSVWLLRKWRKKALSKSEVKMVARQIKERRMPNNRRTKKIHLENVKARQQER